MANKNTLPIIVLIFTVIIWGISFLSIEIVVGIIPPVTLGFYRFVIASVFLFFIKRIKEKEVRMKKKDIPLFAVAGFFGVTLYFIFENNGIMLLDASTASLIIATIPIFSLISESIIFKVKMTGLKIISIILSFIGVYLIVGGDINSLISSGKGVGYIMMFGSVISWVIYSLVTKPLFGKYSQLVIVYYQTLFGTILFIPFIFFETVKWSEVTGNIILNVLYLGIFCSAIGYVTYVYSMKHLGIAVSSIYLNAVPLVTVIAAFFILNEEITFNKAIGGMLIVISVTVVNLKIKRRKVIPTTHT